MRNVATRQAAKRSADGSPGDSANHLSVEKGAADGGSLRVQLGFGFARFDAQAAVVDDVYQQSVALADHVEVDLTAGDAQLAETDPPQPVGQDWTQTDDALERIGFQTEQRLQQHERAAGRPGLRAARYRVLGRRRAIASIAPETAP